MSRDTLKRVLSETALLNRYLKSRGINPEFVSKDQKVAHSKTNQFKVWMNSHINDSIKESTDKKDTITFDIPLLIRVLEFAREELRSDVNLHKMVERLLSIRGKGTLTMNQYGRIVKEEFEQLDESSKVLFMDLYEAKASTASFRASNAKRGQLNAMSPEERKSHDDKRAEQQRKRDDARLERDRQKMAAKKGVSEGVIDAVKKAWKAVSDFDSMQPKYDGNTPRRAALKKKLSTNNKQKKVSEAKEAKYGGDYQASVLAVKEKAKKKPVDMAALAARMQAAYAKDKKPVKENMEPTAACAQPGDGANTPDDTVPSKKSTASKVKLLLGGKKGIKEEMYDHEKEDKPVTSPGKKVKLDKPGVDAVTKQSPPAAAVLSGGKTMTGEPRDTVEIDPMMKIKKSPDSQKTV